MSDTIVPQGYKTCPKCGEVKPITGFPKETTRKDGLYGYCYICSRQWQRENPEEYREAVRRWQQIKSEKARKQFRQWREANPERHRDNTRRGNMRKNDIRWSVPENIEEILFDVQNGYCLYCQCELMNGYHVDHIIPVVSAKILADTYPGHVPSNLCLTCAHCNQSKHSALLEDWLIWKYPDQMDEILQRVERHIEIMREWE